jgi:hypothetical protein
MKIESPDLRFEQNFPPKHKSSHLTFKNFTESLKNTWTAADINGSFDAGSNPPLANLQQSYKPLRKSSSSNMNPHYIVVEEEL